MLWHCYHRTPCEQLQPVKVLFKNLPPQLQYTLSPSNLNYIHMIFVTTETSVLHK